jgi:hypothetical protein
MKSEGKLTPTGKYRQNHEKVRKRDKYFQGMEMMDCEVVERLYHFKGSKNQAGKNHRAVRITAKDHRS